MAVAKVELTCVVCGKKFEHRRMKYNRQDADSYETWVKGHIDTCPECFKEMWRKRELERGEKMAQKFHLPEITEGTEKQIRYAKSLRGNFVFAHQQHFTELVKNPDQLKNGGISKLFRAALESTNARELIDLFKGF